MTTPNPNLYEILGVSKEATASAIKAAFRQKAKILHPDAGGDPEEFRRLKRAFDVLSDANRREQYDVDSSDIEDEIRMHAILCDVFLKVLLHIEDPQQQDIIALMRSSINDHIKICTEGVNALNILLSRIDIASGQIHTKGAENILTQLIAERRSEIQHKLETVGTEQRLYTQALHFLDEYSYDVQGYFRYVSIDP